ncbi:hypothetical protein BC835DRAFT_1503405 [Cytidiella melzeri]|nr:hypothetical protein BC835DRAFT_1503405 [Cytidiella melzeri]
MEQDDLTTQLERALRRVRSTGDLDLEGSSTRPPRHRGNLRISTDQTPRNVRVSHLQSVDSPRRTIAAPIPAHARDAIVRDSAVPSFTDGQIQTQAQLPLRPPRHRQTRTRPVPAGFKGKLLVFFGLAGPDAKARSQLLNMVWSLGFGLVQYVVVVTLLVIASHRESPTVPGLSEWDACLKPLGVWNSIWLVRVALVCLTGYWDWRRNVTLRQMERRSGSSGDTEAGRPNTGALDRQGSTQPASTRVEGQGDNANPENSLPRTHLFRRLNILSNTLSMVWFLAAHVFEYSSVTTCRHSSPHLWWLTFGILCILYLMLLEIVLIGLVIFIVGPVLFLIYNIVLLCIGRHPIQRAGEVHADIKKIPKSVVDQIPLVLYIPPPPEEDGTKDAKSLISVPSPAHLYPPISPIKPTERTRRFRFAFLRRSKKTPANGKAMKRKGGDSDGEIQTWEDNWVSGEYPFVRLEGHRAACAICLMDFDEPERKDKPKEGVPADKEKPVEPKPIPSSAHPDSLVQEVQVDEVTEADIDRLKLEDAGEGPQPLRLLACGHVFHKTCVDPWLTDVSGRCPVCQRPVEIAENSAKKKRRRGGRNSPPGSS